LKNKKKVSQKNLHFYITRRCREFSKNNFSTPPTTEKNLQKILQKNAATFFCQQKKVARLVSLSCEKTQFYTHQPKTKKRGEKMDISGYFFLSAEKSSRKNGKKKFFKKTCIFTHTISKC